MRSLYRGFNKSLSLNVQTNFFHYVPRVPRETDLCVHNHADAWFLKHFNIRARSSTVICSTDFSQARSYGSTYRITPSEPFIIIYSPMVKDFLEHQAELSSTSREDVWAWLERKQYVSVEKVEDVASDFFGEVMVCCTSFLVEPYV